MPSPITDSSQKNHAGYLLFSVGFSLPLCRVCACCCSAVLCADRARGAVCRWFIHIRNHFRAKKTVRVDCISQRAERGHRERSERRDTSGRDTHNTAQSRPLVSPQNTHRHTQMAKPYVNGQTPARRRFILRAWLHRRETTPVSRHTSHH